MTEGQLSRILVNVAATVPQRGLVLVMGQYLAGTRGRRFTGRSEVKGDDWQVEEMVIFGVGPPTAYDLHTDGMYAFSFRPCGSLRVIEEGEKFVEVVEVAAEPRDAADGGRKYGSS